MTYSVLKKSAVALTVLLFVASVGTSYAMMEGDDPRDEDHRGSRPIAGQVHDAIEKEARFLARFIRFNQDLTALKSQAIDQIRSIQPRLTDPSLFPLVEEAYLLTLQALNSSEVTLDSLHGILRQNLAYLFQNESDQALVFDAVKDIITQYYDLMSQNQDLIAATQRGAALMGLSVADSGAAAAAATGAAPAHEEDEEDLFSEGTRQQIQEMHLAQRQAEIDACKQRILQLMGPGFKWNNPADLDNLAQDTVEGNISFNDLVTIYKTVRHGLKLQAFAWAKFRHMNPAASVQDVEAFIPQFIIKGYTFDSRQLQRLANGLLQGKLSISDVAGLNQVRHGEKNSKIEALLGSKGL